MWTEPAFSRYEALLKRLHDLNLEDKLDSPEADLVREDMEEPWSSLVDSERAVLAGLSSDLYSFSREEVTRDSDLDKIELVKRPGTAYQNRDWRGLLEALRFTHQYFPAEQVAYMRARCWQQLGRPEPAFWFFDRAHKLAPSSGSYAFLRLDALFRASHRQEAFAEAQQLLLKDAAPAPLLFGATKVIYDSAAGLPLEESRSLYESIVAAVSAALRTIDHSEAIEATMPQSLILSGRLHLALALERLGTSEAAMQAYADAIAHHPNSDELLMARALFLLRTDQHAAAQKDLDALIGRGTNLASAYLFRAHRFLMQKDYARCLEVADRGLRVATHTATRVMFLEWIAISLYELLYERRASLDGVRSYLEAALSLDPMNENVRSNLQALDRVSFTSHPSLTTQVVPDPSAALQDLRNQLQPAA